MRAPFTFANLLRQYSDTCPQRVRRKRCLLLICIKVSDTLAVALVI